MYLDSRDFSSLADSKVDANQRVAQMNALIRLAASGKAKFVYSAIHISEAAPVRESATDLAVDRAKVLVHLCGTNALVSPDQLIAHEVKQLNDRAHRTFNIMAKNGDWFPALGNVFSEIQPLRLGLTDRKARRARERQTMRNPAAQAHSDGVILKRIREKYPMREDTAKVFLAFILGKASEGDAMDALLRTLRDPSYMMQWFESSHATLSPIFELVRRPAVEMHGALTELREAVEQFLRSKTEISNSLNEIVSEFGIAPPKLLASTDLISRDWAMSRFTQFVNRLGDQTLRDFKSCEDPSIISRLCPGLWTMWALKVQITWDIAIEQGRKQPKTSDFVDVLHSMYAPYVRYFSADRYMAPKLTQILRSRAHEVTIINGHANLVERLGKTSVGAPLEHGCVFGRISSNEHR